jgi:hypothetical protein
MPLRRSVKNGHTGEDAGAYSLKYMQFTESICHKDTEQEDRACYPDESKKDIECLFYGRYVDGSD